MSSWHDRLRCTSAWVTCLCKGQCLISNKILIVVVTNVCVGWASVPWVLCTSTSTRVGTVYRAFCHCTLRRYSYVLCAPLQFQASLCVASGCLWVCTFHAFVGLLSAFPVPELVHAKVGMHSLRGAIPICQACLPVTACMLLTNIPNHALNRTWTLSSAIWT